MHLYPFHIRNQPLALVRITYRFKIRKYLLDIMLQLVDRIRQFQDQRLGIEFQLSSIELRMELELDHR